ncbi:unnamed protein product [Lepeophtheirus salmonis]|uniref:Protein TEX261 n=1 Tax=Lepeophtheirus salmonis TaxID=72036 RepID=A0A7R8CEY8_LEPSM|nr:unnamed protein product [Lepeophtheirus salmonis]CAF2800662.1 unnamed protein product [Lepeophtheirus salmonis]
MLHVFLAVMTIAAGLYYLADIVEEYTMMTSKVIKWSVMTTLGLYVGLFLFEGFPTTLVLCVFSPSFIIAIAGTTLVPNHGFLFCKPLFGFSILRRETHYSFTEVMAYFTLCLCLPTLSERRPLLSEENDVVSNYFLRKENKYGLRAGFAALKEIFLPSRGKKSY